MSAPSVCVLSNEFFPVRGGIATFAEEMAAAAQRLGHAVEVWAPEHSEARRRQWPFRYHGIRMAGTQNISCQLRLAISLLRHRSRLAQSTLYVPDPGSMLSLAYVPILRPRRLVLTFCGSEIQRFAENIRLRFIVSQIIRRADQISAVSHYTYQLLLRHFPMAAGKSIVTHGGLRRGLIEPGDAPPKPEGRVLLLTVGRIHPRKGQHHVLQALGRLPGRFKDKVEYWIVGTGNKEDYDKLLAAEARRCGVRVRFLGAVDDAGLAALYRAADIFALTSVNHGHSMEGFGLVYLEAAAHGLPVVAHDVGGVRDAVDEGQNGYILPVGDHDALSRALQRLIVDPGLRKRFGRHGQAFARRFSWEESASNLFGSPRAARV